MIRIKISTENISDTIRLEEYVSAKSDIFKNFQFSINNPMVQEADYWIVLDNNSKFDTECYLPKQNVILLRGETIFPFKFVKNNLKIKNYHNQFSNVYSHFDNHKQFTNLPYLPWMINSNHSTYFHEKIFNFEDLKNDKKISKTYVMSVICSDKKMTLSQKKRLKFVKNLKKELGDQLHWFGNGINSIKYKHEGIFPYKYHIVLENQSQNNVITEKLFDSFLGQSFPIYWGAPNVYEYFNRKALVQIDINDFKSSYKKIIELIENDEYENNFKDIIKAKNKVLNDFNLINRILKIVSILQKRNHKLEREYVKIIPLNKFSIYDKINLFKQLKKI